MPQRVLLLSMPFGALERPALGISLLREELRHEGILCDVKYLLFAFAEQIGAERYAWITHGLPYTAFAGDWLFTEALYGPRPQADAEYIRSVLQQTWALGDQELRNLLHVRSQVPAFLERCESLVDWDSYGVVGFTSTFEQNLASLALAARIKKRYPHLITVFGGANWEAEMGLELHRRFSFVDFVCSGEADRTLPLLVHSWFAGRSVADLPGIVYRNAAGESVTTGRAPLVKDLDALPTPAFDDYFAALSTCTTASAVVPILLVEMSRGCWWGAKSHCTFCGLNGGAMTFRSKSSGRALAELNALVDRWKIDMVEVVDNILDMRYFRDLIPSLAAQGGAITLFFEVKSNLSREQVQHLAAAGIRRIQPGIESLSDHVLTLMRKGTSGLRNVQLLKWAHELGIEVDWNLLYGFPGERREDYDQVLTLMRAIRFLRPPCAVGPIRLDRFSPYFETPEAFGIINVRPIAPYEYLYPFDAAAVRRIAYYFDFSYRDDMHPHGAASAAVEYADSWRNAPERGALRAVRGDESLALVDTRSYASQPVVRLAGMDRAAYEFCDEMHTTEAVIAELRRQFPDVPCDAHQVALFLESLVANNLMVTDGEYYLSLACSAGGVKEDGVYSR